MPLPKQMPVLALVILPMVFSLANLASANTAPVVSNVQAVQIAGTGQVRITFDVADADGDQVTARAIASPDNGGTFNLLPVSVSGDCNRAMSAGTGKQIIWNAAADYPGRAWTQVVVKVYASDGPAFSGEMVLVPAGAFVMGTSSYSYYGATEHIVLLDAYYIDKYEVTNAEFGQFITAGGYSTQAFWSAEGWLWKNSAGRSRPTRYDATLPGFPVSGVTWYEAAAYANFAGKRLPTEAEWEKAAKGEDSRLYPWGAAPADDAHLNRGGFPWNSSSGTSPVGYYDGTTHTTPAFTTADGRGPYGTFDQSGNVAEWVNDWVATYPTGTVVNPQGPSTGSLKVVRGGDANPSGTSCVVGDYYSTSGRLASLPSHEGPAQTICGRAAYYTGFRCAKSAQ